MKRFLLISIFMLRFLCGDCPAAGGPLANADKKGLYIRSIDEVLRLDENDVDLATAALIISEKWSDTVFGRKYLYKLDDIAIELRDRIKKKNIGMNYKTISVINEYLFDESGFKPVAEAINPDDLFLHTVLDKKRGYCLSLSILYLSIGERLGLPLYGVVVPGHFFVRYDDGQMRFNIETTSKGGSATNEHYINKFKVPENNGIYMKNLNKIQTLGCFLNNLGNVYLDKDNINSAQSALEKAVEINPSLAESHMNLGNIYLKQNKLEDAIYEYQEALKINPGEAKVHNNLGNAYARRGWLDYAISEYEAAFGLEPNFADAYKNIAGAYCQKKMFERAKYYIQEAITLEPKQAGGYMQLGDVYTQTGRYEEAIEQYKKALNIQSDLADAHYNMATCYNKLDLVDKEIAAYRKTLAIKPDFLAALINLGNAYFNKQDYDAAIEQYNKAVTVKADDATIHYNLGTVYSHKENYQLAVAEYKKAIELDSKMGDAHNRLAFSYYKLKEYKLALNHIKTAEQLGVEISKELLEAIEDRL